MEIHIWVIYMIHNRSLSFLCERNVLCIHITISPFFCQVWKGMRKRRCCLTRFWNQSLKQRQLLTCQTWEPSISLFPVQCLAHWITKSSKVKKNTKNNKPHPWSYVFCQVSVFKSKLIHPPLFLLLRSLSILKSYRGVKNGLENKIFNPLLETP